MIVSNNDTFCDKIESAQFNAALAISRAIRGSSRERLYQELGLESLFKRQWYRRLLMFYKIVSGIAPNYLRTLLPTNYYIRTKIESFENAFFP